MIGWCGKLSPQVRSLLDRERAIPAQPAVVRARALARARAAVAAGISSQWVPERVPRGTRWAAAAVVVCVASAAAAATAYRIGVRRHPVAPPVALSPRSAPSEPPSRPTLNAVADPPAAPVRPRAPSPSKVDTIREELRLLRQARAAVARMDFATALVPLGELGRRFRNGHLAEEREALRVKALVGLGRTDEARRAALTFEARFPRSVLLSAIDQMTSSR